MSLAWVKRSSVRGPKTHQPSCRFLRDPHTTHTPHRCLQQQRRVYWSWCEGFLSCCSSLLFLLIDHPFGLSWERKKQKTQASKQIHSLNNSLFNTFNTHHSLSFNCTTTPSIDCSTSCSTPLLLHSSCHITVVTISRHRSVPISPPKRFFLPSTLNRQRHLTWIVGWAFR